MRGRKTQPFLVMIVTSRGGHMEQAIKLVPTLTGCNYCVVTEEHESEVPAAFQSVEVRYVAPGVTPSLRLKQIVQLVKIIANTKPAVMISFGAGCGAMACVVARLFRIRCVFVESLAAVVRPTKSGWLAYRIATDFFYQWPSMIAHYPNGRYEGNVYGIRLHR